MKYIFIANKGGTQINYKGVPEYIGEGIFKKKNKEKQKVDIPMTYSYSSIEFDDRWVTRRDKSQPPAYRDRFFLTTSPGQMIKRFIKYLPVWESGKWFKVHCKNIISLQEGEANLRGWKVNRSCFILHLAKEIHVTQQTWR